MFDSRQEQQIFLFPHCVQTGSEDHSASYPMGTGNSFPGVKRQRREADHSPPSSADVSNGGDTPSLAHTFFIAYCLINYAQDVTCFTLILMDFRLQTLKHLSSPGKDHHNSPLRHLVFQVFHRATDFLDYSPSSAILFG
jgi:hypothetical protein